MPAGYLLDTNIVSALGPGGDDLSPRAVAWVARRENALCVSVVTVIEIETGLEKLRLRGADRKAARVAEWFETFKASLASSFIGVDYAVAAEAGRLIAREYAAGRQPEFADALIGATATVHGLVLVTRNTRHFESFGVELVDPFSI